ncbi:EF-hand calcium-binding domain-containing protein 14 isoform X2 [Chanos chanos]|uniref:EF-hand calcium-binding domain-containing protein 14 isoform X2 n=1 Tax=Chanos chanos TaxID=29144 RepID=A0A6J2VC35_CHACN|nr:EF-hand calcium-binding domain-containing protein 14 isoform X2 [Chanos chanos]
MKKRKELNALIGLGDSKRKKTKKGSGHRLLRTEPPDSESESSSGDDEFNNLNSVAAFGKSYARCCSICYPLCVFVILAACVMACAGLIWMQIALKEDLDSLKDQLHSMESSQKVSSHEILKLNEELKTKQRKLEDMESGERGLNKLWSNLTEINRKINALDSAVIHLKANIKSASDLIHLPTTVEEIQKSVATIGSTLTSVQHDMTVMQTFVEDQRKQANSQSTDKKDSEIKPLNVIFDSNKGSSNLSCSSLKEDIRELQESFGEVNSTQVLHHAWTREQFSTVHSALSSLTHRLSSLESSSSTSQPNDLPLKTESLTRTQAAEGPQDLPDNTKRSSGSKPTRRPRFLSPDRVRRKRSETHKTVSFPGVSTLKDLEMRFQHARLDQTAAGVSYEELRRLFGPSTPEVSVLADFDSDGDQRYSLGELQAAAGV